MYTQRASGRSSAIGSFKPSQTSSSARGTFVLHSLWLRGITYASRCSFSCRGSIAAEVMAFHQENLADRQTVGMHIRTHTLGHPGYIEPYALADNRGHFLNSYWKCAHFASGGTGVVALEEAPLIFLAVDNGAVRHEAARVFGGQLVVRDAPIARGSA
jgi:hypothetical protein